MSENHASGVVLSTQNEQKACLCHFDEPFTMLHLTLKFY